MAEPSTRDRILDTADGLLRRYGARKFAVVDVARALDMSHSNVYRFFKSKGAIFEAIAARWLCDAEVALQAVADGPGAAPDRILDYVLTLYRIKRRKVLENREIFETYAAVVEGCHGVLRRHLADLRAVMRQIIAGGVEDGSLRLPPGRDIDGVVLALEHATLRFRIPQLVLTSVDEDVEDQIRVVVALLLNGLAHTDDRG